MAEEHRENGRGIILWQIGGYFWSHVCNCCEVVFRIKTVFREIRFIIDDFSWKKFFLLFSFALTFKCNSTKNRLNILEGVYLFLFQHPGFNEIITMEAIKYSPYILLKDKKSIKGVEYQHLAEFKVSGVRFVRNFKLETLKIIWTHI